MAAPRDAPSALDAKTLGALTLGPRPWVDLIVATLQDEPIGYAALHRTLQFGQAIKVMEMTELYVIPQLRRQGIGRALIDGACLEARLAGCQALSVGTADGDGRAAALYRTVGFVDRPSVGAQLVRAL